MGYAALLNDSVPFGASSPKNRTRKWILSKIRYSSSASSLRLGQQRAILKADVRGNQA
jgi:hypothetical protein